MKTFIADIIPKIQRFSKKLDDLTILTNHHWVSLTEIANSKTVYIFRADKKLLVSENGQVTKGTWEYLGHNSILFETNSQTLLLKHGFVDEHIMALKIDGVEGFLFLINETKYGREINTIADISKFLEKKYFENNSTSTRSYSINDKGLPEYEESFPIESFDIVYGNHDKIEISFADGINGEIFRGHSTNKYFFHHFTWGKIYCDNKYDCIIKLYRDKKYNE